MISKLLDKMSNYLARRKGLLPLLGIGLILLNFIVQFILPTDVAGTNILLHLGLIIAIFGLMLARAL